VLIIFALLLIVFFEKKDLFLSTKSLNFFCKNKKKSDRIYVLSDFFVNSPLNFAKVVVCKMLNS